MIPQAELDQRAEFLATMPREMLGCEIVEVRAWQAMDGSPYRSSEAIVITRGTGGDTDTFSTHILSWHRNPEGGWGLDGRVPGLATLELARRNARERAEDEQMYLLLCEWYADCDNYADGSVANPILGAVPTCTRCATKHNKTLVPFGKQS